MVFTGAMEWGVVMVQQLEGLLSRLEIVARL
jgi:hypothetical protein